MIDNLFIKNIYPDVVILIKKLVPFRPIGGDVPGYPIFSLATRTIIHNLDEVIIISVHFIKNIVVSISTIKTFIVGSLD
ncbi:Uncharacterised protein [Streptococcus pneumoniae]|nr:Uncharacterised protein [Streptococcus pneumoniae]VKB40165.1 Uncharacterised protein [Streptococcus pneumoniae]VMF70655.1 Uncharacterised protein [Streptococcus pneumoniae]